ncbi:MAG TPA: sigma-54-dependent Fis family transcriptional regulator, partial [Kofleriaceae bacterium]|nr:sigma-54-dependent Fis family transcriptional regulator [Kofleriaceae bacterium]
MSADRTLSYAEVAGGADRTFVSPYLVVALECERPLAAPVRLSLGEVDACAIGRGEERGWTRESDGGRATLRLRLPDGWMSGRHAAIVRGEGGWMVSDEGSKNGTFVNGAAVTEAALADGDLIEAGSTCFLFRDRARRDPRDPADLTAGAARHPALATLNPDLARQLSPLVPLAGSSVPIVLAGATGTGKELTARAVHDLSGRPGAFVAVNCGALPEALVEGELFGARRGAYSGATEDRPGLVRAAHRGTLFLDEVAELPPASQVKLLRVLQEEEVLPLGATAPVPVDLRVVAASHASLPELVESGRFRADLYARLAGATVALPPLCERREDIGLIAAAVLRGALGDEAHAVRFEREAGRALFLHR